MTEQIKQEAVDFNGTTIGYLVRGSLEIPQLAWIAEPADYRETRERRYTASREDAVAWLLERHVKAQDAAGNSPRAPS